jgi:hypothetical protein
MLAYGPALTLTAVAIVLLGVLDALTTYIAT